MNRFRRLLAWITALCLAMCLGACSSPPLGATAEDGRIEWTLLGVQNLEQFGDVTPSDGFILIVVYLEAVNKTPQDVYISENGLDTDTEIIPVDETALPRSYSNFGARIASGKRRLFCLCFEQYEQWSTLEIAYTSHYIEADMSFSLKGKDYREAQPLSEGDTAYPIDRRDNAELLADMQTVYRREYEAQWNMPPNPETAARYEAEIVTCEQGAYFSTVEYADARPSNWGPAKHLSNLQDLIRCYGEERLKTDAAARSTVLSLLDYWFAKDYHSTNWWYNELSNPRTLASIGMMLRPYLSEAQFDLLDVFIGRGTLRGSHASAGYTGANLTNLMSITVSHGLLVNDPDLIFAAMYRAAEELRIVDYGQEGMQADGTFFQHETLLHAATGYGTEFAQSVSYIVTKLHDTCFALPEEKIALFVDHLLDGQRYFHRSLVAAYFSGGRFATSSSVKTASAMKTTVQALSSCDGMHRRDELRDYAASFDDMAKILDDTQYFPLAYALVNSAPSGYFAVRGAHEGTSLTEAINGQNQLGYNLSYGANTCYMYDGDEYASIAAVMDLAMFPGTTAYHEPDAVLAQRYVDSYKTQWGHLAYRGTHCGGASDDATHLGGLYMELVNDGIGGKLAFITYDGGVIALGAGISCDQSGNTYDIRTTVNQCAADGARVGDTALTVGNTVSVTDGTAVYNGAFAYYDLGGGTLTASVDTLTGTTRRNNAAGTNELCTADVFRLYYSHGTALENGSYAYAVTTVKNGTVPSNAADLPIRTITNTETVQAVEFTDGHAVVVFHAAGSYTLSSGETVTADAPAVIIR